MGYQDRPYYRDREGGPFNPLIWLMSGSVPLFTVFGIRVRAHATLVLFVVLELLFSGSNSGLGPRNAVTSMSLLFISVLLHEFGHCFGARWVGGEANDILMHPLGGLASTSPPHRWTAHLFSTAAGPAVNLIICLITGTWICIAEGSISSIPWFPMAQPLKFYVPSSMLMYYLWWIFLVNYAILTFNMLMVFYPFDAGRMVQELLWWRIGYYKSMWIATTVGMVGAVAVALFALAYWWGSLFFIAAFGFYACYTQRQAILAAGPEGFSDDTDYSAAYETFRPKKQSNRAIKRAQKLKQAERAEQEQIDQILAKVSAKGMHSLSWFEKRALKKATENQKKRSAELSRLRRE